LLVALDDFATIGIRMAKGSDDPTEGGIKVRVASRALKRGRKLRASLRPAAPEESRDEQAPPEAEATEQVARDLDWDDEPKEQAAKPPQVVGPSIQVRESTMPDYLDEADLKQLSRYSRPPAPMLDFGGKRDASRRPSLQELAEQSVRGEDDFGEPASGEPASGEPVGAPRVGAGELAADGDDREAQDEGDRARADAASPHPGVQLPPFDESTLVSTTGISNAPSSRPPPVRIADSSQASQERSVSSSPPSDEQPTALAESGSGASGDEEGGPGSAPSTPTPAQESKPSSKLDAKPLATPRSQPVSKPASTPRSKPASSRPLSSAGAARETVAQLEQGWPLVNKLAAAAVVALIVGGIWWTQRGPKAGAKSAPSATASVADRSRAPKPNASAPAVEPAPDSEPSAEVPSDDYEQVKRRTLDLLNKRKFVEAEALAKRLIELRPDDALGYRCLGSALQDQGRVPEAKAVYSDCVTRATKGDVIECAQLGGAAKKQ
jgi:hypothetical protein